MLVKCLESLKADSRQGDIARCEWLAGRLESHEATSPRPKSISPCPNPSCAVVRCSPNSLGVLLARGEALRRRGSFDEARRFVDDGFEIARLRNMVPVHADALVLRGRVQPSLAGRGGPSSAIPRVHLITVRDDLEAALQLSQLRGLRVGRRGNVVPSSRRRLGGA